jgi:ubiquitin-like 1-activating enzyme E1 B
MNPRLNMQVKKDNLFNYSTVFFSEFDVLISALDNNQARLYLNQVAIDHCVPMIDAGTSGFNGQSQLF